MYFSPTLLLFGIVLREALTALTMEYMVSVLKEDCLSGFDVCLLCKFFTSVFSSYPTTPSSCEIKLCAPHLGVHKHFRSCRMARKLDKVENNS